MIFVLLYVPIAIICIIILYMRYGQMSVGTSIAYATLFIVSPLLSFRIFDRFDYIKTIGFLEAGFISFTLVLFVLSILVGRKDGDILEKGISLNSKVALIYVSMAILALYGSFEMYKIVFSNYSISSLNDLNAAFLDPNLPSFGIYGRLNRLSIPLGLLSFIMILVTKNQRHKYFFMMACIFFTTLLVGIRRSVLFDQIVMYMFAYISIVTNLRTMFRSIIVLLAGLCILTYSFGAIQIATNKSNFTSPLASGLYDGGVYFAGNLAYSECISYNGYEFDKRNSFPFFYMLKYGADSDIKKPFCNIDIGIRFNTSPVYYDLALDGGYAMIIIYMAILSALLVFAMANRIKLFGIYIFLLTTLIFGVRENLLGQYDFVFAILMYPILVLIFRKLSRRNI